MPWRRVKPEVFLYIVKFHLFLQGKFDKILSSNIIFGVVFIKKIIPLELVVRDDYSQLGPARLVGYLSSYIQYIHVTFW